MKLNPAEKELWPGNTFGHNLDNTYVILVDKCNRYKHVFPIGYTAMKTGKVTWLNHAYLHRYQNFLKIISCVNNYLK